MVRFIIKYQSRVLDEPPAEALYTLDCDCPQLELQLQRGGRSETSYERNTLVGAEVIQTAIKSRDHRVAEAWREVEQFMRHYHETGKTPDQLVERVHELIQWTNGQS